MDGWTERWKKCGAVLRETRLAQPRAVWLGAIGVLLLVCGGLFDGSWTAPATRQEQAPQAALPQVAAPAGEAAAEERALEEKLAALLSKVRGAGHVSVSVTLADDGAQRHAANTMKETKTVEEKDTSGGVRTTSESKESVQVLLRKDSGADRPVSVLKTRPRVQGVLVVAEGASDSAVKARLTEAVRTGLGVASHKIEVLPQGR